MAADPYDPTFPTKWGRLTSQEYQWRKRQEVLEEWLTPELLAYLEENWPSPEQIAENRRRRAAELEETRRRNLKQRAISDCIRVDRARPGSASRARITTPATQLNIL